MARWSRLLRTFRSDRVSDEFDEELASHIEEGIAHGRDPDDVRRAVGEPVRLREQSRDFRILPWLDGIRADVRFASRQLLKHRVTSAAAVLSLGLSMGACVAAFRIVDAMLLRPLPIAHPDRLFELVRAGTNAQGVPTEDDGCEYPLFVRMRDLVRDRADLIAISPSGSVDVYYGSAAEPEKAYRQFVSGAMFGVFGLKPAIGRVLTPDDDAVQGASPYAVLSYDFWSRRFGRDPAAIGTTFRVGPSTFQVIGVVQQGFVGTEPGVPVDFFVPTMMNPQVTRADSSWFRAFVSLHAGVQAGPVVDQLGASLKTFLEERQQTLVGQSAAQSRAFVNQVYIARPAGAGASSLQRSYTTALIALASFVALVLLIACANIASLNAARNAARTREMALRASIGAGRGRLAQLMLIESALVALAGALIGACVAWPAAPFVVSRLNPPARAIALSLPLDWRIVVFSVLLTFGIAIMLGFMPAVRLSATASFDILKAGTTIHRKRRSLHAPVVGQVAFCTLVLLVAGLFVASFDRLSSRPIGFTPKGLITLDATAQPSQMPTTWSELAADLGAVPGVEATAASSWALLSGVTQNGSIWRHGAPTTDTRSFFLGITPGWLRVMEIPLVEGRDLREADRSQSVAIVNEAFVKEFFPDGHPIGQTFERQVGLATRPVYEIVGVVRDARYRNVREPMMPTAFISLSAFSPTGAPRALAEATLVVRASAANPSALAPALRRVVQAKPAFRVTGVETQQAIVDAQLVRERLLATLAGFFALVAIALTAIGIYGVMHYTVQERQREIGVRRAVGAGAASIVWQVTSRIGIVIGAGTLAGVSVGLLVVRFLTSLVFEVRATDARQLAVPLVAVLGTGIIAALPPVLRAVRVSPTIVLRSE